MSVAGVHLSLGGLNHDIFLFSWDYEYYLFLIRGKFQTRTQTYAAVPFGRSFAYTGAAKKRPAIHIRLASR